MTIDSVEMAGVHYVACASVCVHVPLSSVICVQTLYIVCVQIKSPCVHPSITGKDADETEPGNT